VRALIFVLLAGLACSCQNAEAVALERVKQRVCACKDVACAEAALAEVPHGDAKASHHAQSIARDMLDCLAKLYDAQRPSTDPDAPGSGAP
jgi:hypothetical protein